MMMAEPILAVCEGIPPGGGSPEPKWHPISDEPPHNVDLVIARRGYAIVRGWANRRVRSGTLTFWRHDDEGVCRYVDAMGWRLA